jgi:hypothetical protein
MSWADEYREIVEFYWWEPQMMGRSLKNYRKFNSADEMWASVSCKEVPFNHVLNIFFALFPLDHMNFGFTPGAAALSSRALRDLYKKQHGATQPDIFIVDDALNTAIELKTTSKSSAAQVEKYIAFNNAIAPEKPLRLVFLSPHDNPQKVFGGEVPAVSDCQMEFLSFRKFYLMLQSAKCENATERKLIAGVLEYMEEYFSQWIAGRPGDTPGGELNGIRRNT